MFFFWDDEYTLFSCSHMTPYFGVQCNRLVPFVAHKLWLVFFPLQQLIDWPSVQTRSLNESAHHRTIK